MARQGSSGAKCEAAAQTRKAAEEPEEETKWNSLEAETEVKLENRAEQAGRPDCPLKLFKFIQPTGP